MVHHAEISFVIKDNSYHNSQYTQNIESIGINPKFSDQSCCIIHTFPISLLSIVIVNIILCIIHTKINYAGGKNTRAILFTYHILIISIILRIWQLNAKSQFNPMQIDIQTFAQTDGTLNNLLCNQYESKFLFLLLCYNTPLGAFPLRSRGCSILLWWIKNG